MLEDLRKWNSFIKRQDGFYHSCAKKCGLPDAQFWILYAMCENTDTLCQNTFCENWCYSKQTVNAAVSALEKAGLICLRFTEKSKKRKALYLTKEGQKFCDENIREILSKEEKALLSLTNEERKQFFALYFRLITELEKETEDERK